MQHLQLIGKKKGEETGYFSFYGTQKIRNDIAGSNLKTIYKHQRAWKNKDKKKGDGGFTDIGDTESGSQRCSGSSSKITNIGLQFLVQGHKTDINNSAYATIETKSNRIVKDTSYDATCYSNTSRTSKSSGLEFMGYK